MARGPDGRRRAEWRARFDRFSRSGVTVTRFCDGEGVSVASFYRWRKVLGPVAERRRGRRRGSALPGIFRPIEVASAPPAEMAWAAPIVVPAGSAVGGAASAEVVAGAIASAEIVPASGVSIHLPCGTRIEVDAKHLDAVRVVIGEVARAHQGVPMGTSSC